MVFYLETTLATHTNVSQVNVDVDVDVDMKRKFTLLDRRKSTPVWGEKRYMCLSLLPVSLLGLFSVLIIDCFVLCVHRGSLEVQLQDPTS